MNIFERLIVQPIFNALLGIYAIVPGADFGLAVIIFTVIVRMLVYPIYKKQMFHTKAVRDLKPQIKKINESDITNEEKTEAIKTLLLDNGIKNSRPIIRALIQIPIFMSLYLCIKIFTVSRERVPEFTYSFMKNFSGVAKIVDNPSSFNEHLLGFINLSHSAISFTHGINFYLVALALLAVVIQYVLTRRNFPKSTSNKSFQELMIEASEKKITDMDELNSAMVNKFLWVIPLATFFTMLIVPGVIALYYATSNGVLVLQQAWILHKQNEELDEIILEEDHAEEIEEAVECYEKFEAKEEAEEQAEKQG